MLQAASSRLLSMSGVDVAVVILYFVAVLGIGFYLKGFTKTGEDFFLAGREMTAWMAGLSFVAANLGSLELMGWAGLGLSIRHPRRALVLDRRHSRHAVPRHGDDAVLLHLANSFRPRLFETALRRSRRALLSAISFGFMTVLMSGINMYSMALVMKVVLGWDINFSIWVSSLTVAIYVVAGRIALGHLQRSPAVRSDLAGRVADLHHRPDRGGRLERHGGAHHA